MIFHVLSLFPEAFTGFLSSSILGKAIERNLIRVNLVNIRDFALDKHKSCDDATYGGGPGMVLKAEPVAAALEAIPGKANPVLFMSPSGKLFSQSYAALLSEKKEVIIICGHYEGIDQRIIDKYVTDEISVGDYILSSGIAASLVVIDAVSRLVKGVINEESHMEESFQRGLLEYPHYTRPDEFNGMKVPEVLLSGHHANIERWRLKERLKKTFRNRPELLDSVVLDKGEKELLEKVIQEEKKIKEGDRNGFD